MVSKKKSAAKELEEFFSVCEMPKAKKRLSGKKLKNWLAIRKKAARKIDPKTAEVMWSYAFDGDPYDVVIKIPERAKQVGRQQYARSPGSDVWVWFDDLPKTIERALWKKHGAKLMFPARLPSSIFED